MTVHRVKSDQRLDHAICAACAATRPDRRALADEEESITFAELGADSDVAANQLTAAGLESDEPVLVPVSNRARDLVAFFAVWRAGGVVVPVHRKTPAAELERLMERTGARLLFSLRPDIAVADNIAGDASVPPPWETLLRRLLVLATGERAISHRRLAIERLDLWPGSGRSYVRFLVC